MDPLPRKSRWQKWLGLLFGLAAVVALIYFGPPGQSFRDYRMMSGNFEKHFRAGSGGQAKDTEFIVRGCRPTGPPGEGRRDGLKSISQQADGQLAVKYVVSTNCLAPFAHGSYAIAGNALNLTYRIDWPDDRRAACLCSYELEYRISNLPLRDYAVTIRNESRP